MLSQLKIVDVLRTTGGTDDVTVRVRAKLVSAIKEQAASVDAAIKKEPFKATRKVGGEERERRFRPWWWKGAGFHYTTINYGTSPIPLPGGKSIEAGPKMEDLLTVYEAVIGAVEAGELDAALLAAAAKRGRKGNGTGAEGATEGQETPASTATTRRRTKG